MTAYLANFMRPQGKHNEHYIDLVKDINRGRGFLNRTGGGGGAQTTIGTIIVNTKATDAAGIARDLPRAIQRRSMTAQANTGLE